MPKINLSKRDRIIVVSLILLVILIPTGTYVLSLRAKTESQAQEYTRPVTSQKSEASSSSRLQEALDRLNADSGTPAGSSSKTAGASTGATDDAEGSALTDAQLVLGPTLGLSVLLQARPLDNMSTQAFLGIAAGQPTNKPTYLLSFMINIPASGAFDGISLQGLDSGATYTAYIKGSAQIATASAFVVKATPTNIGAQIMYTGDVNEDNVIDSLDYNLVKGAIGTSPASSNWNPLYDFNLDNIVNSWDLNMVLANIGKIGASGPWYSTSPIATASASASGSLTKDILPGTQNQGSPSGNPSDKTTDGYWMWVPGF